MRLAHHLAIAIAVLWISTDVRAQTAALGSWEMTTISPEGTFVSRLEIKQDGDKLVAVARGAQGERPYDSVSVDGSRITLVLTISYNGSPMVITYRGQIAGKEMSGDADFGGLASGSWSAEQQ